MQQFWLWKIGGKKQQQNTKHRPLKWIFADDSIIFLPPLTARLCSKDTLYVSSLGFQKACAASFLDLCWVPSLLHHEWGNPVDRRRNDITRTVHMPETIGSNIGGSVWQKGTLTRSGTFSWMQNWNLAKSDVLVHQPHTIIICKTGQILLAFHYGYIEFQKMLAFLLVTILLSVNRRRFKTYPGCVTVLSNLEYLSVSARNISDGGIFILASFAIWNTKAIKKQMKKCDSLIHCKLFFFFHELEGIKTYLQFFFLPGSLLFLPLLLFLQLQKQ